MSRKIYLAITFVLAAALVAAWYFLAPTDQTSENNVNDVPDLGAEAPIAVKVQYARQGTLVLRLTATGYTRAIRQVPFTAQVAGVVDSLPVYEGKKVRKGELLLKINDADYRLAVTEAREQLNQTIVTYGQQRAERLQATIRIDTSLGYFLDPRRTEKAYRQAESDYAAGKISQETFFLLKSEYEAAQIFAEESKQRLIALRSGLNKAMIGLQRAELNLSRTWLTAPFAGIVANLKINLGQPLNAGAECFTLVNLDTILIDVEILESEAPQVEMGRNATATFAAFPNELFKGKVVAINPLVDVEKRVRRAVVAIANKDHRLIPGLYAQVKIESQFLTNRLIVPKEAIVLRDQRKVVFIVRSEAGEGDGERGRVGERESGREGERVRGRLLAKWCYVETGAENEEEVEILSSAFNLQPGEPVVVTNHFTMAHDTPVRVE
ncbi:MAG: efflux RND transporter periplasmic adaptor subunit [candidate division KSB1 bacterium]|nr:efflux RND transporter periplasmic adaptor subunit [candidate division KSB1 bacterium]